MAVMHSFREKYDTPRQVIGFSAWLASFPPWSILVLFAAVAFTPMIALAQQSAENEDIWQVLLRWMPLLLTKGFALNILISFTTMGLGTLGGIF